MALMAASSTWRTRSRVMLYFLPISSKVFFFPSLVRPKRFMITSEARCANPEVILLVTFFGLNDIVDMIFKIIFLILPYQARSDIFCGDGRISEGFPDINLRSSLPGLAQYSSSFTDLLYHPTGRFHRDIYHQFFIWFCLLSVYFLDDDFRLGNLHLK